MAYRTPIRSELPPLLKQPPHLPFSQQIPIPLLPSPLKGEKQNVFPPLQGEGKGGGGVKQMSIQLMRLC
jgi:hypothetical protein